MAGHTIIQDEKEIFKLTQPLYDYKYRVNKWSRLL